MRASPNIIVTGTPGVGKTIHCETLAQSTGLKHFDISRLVKERECHEGWDEEYKSWIVDEDKLLDSIEDEVKEGGYILDWHACEVFPKSWIDLVVVLRVDSKIHYDRLTARGYKDKKLEENIDSEIMEVLLQEAKESYDEEIVVELKSNTTEDMESNVERIQQWIQQWKKDRVGDTE